MTKQEFLDRAREMHGYKYQYPTLTDKILSTDNIDIIYMSLDNFATSIKLRLLSAQSRDIVDIYQDINVSDLKIGENKIPITNPQIIRLLKNSSRVYKVSMVNEYTGMGTISKTGEDYTTTNQYLLGYDTDSSDASSESGAIADMDVDSELHTDASTESGASAYASSESELHTAASSDSETSMDSY